MLIILRQAHVVEAAERHHLLVELRIQGHVGLHHRDAVPAHPGKAGIQLLIGLFFQGVDAGIHAVDVQHAVLAALVHHLVGGLGAKLLAQLVADDGAGEVLAGAEQQIGEFRDAAAIDVIVQGGLTVGVPEADGHVLLGQHQTGLPVHGHAAAYGEALPAVIEGQAGRQLDALLAAVVHRVKLPGAVRQQAQHRQAVVFVDHKAEAQRPAGQGALLQVHGPDDGGLIDIDGPGIFLTVRRGGGAVQGIADAAGSGEFHGDALHIVEYPVLCEAYRLFRHGAAAAGIFFSRTGGGEVEPALLPLLPAVAGLIRDVPQGNKILQLPLTVGEIELLIAGVQTEAGAQGGLQQGLLLGAEHQPQLPRLQAQLRQAEFYRVIPVVRQAVVRQQHRLVGDVFQLHPIVVFAPLGQGGTVVDHHFVDHQ